MFFDLFLVGILGLTLAPNHLLILLMDQIQLSVTYSSNIILEASFNQAFDDSWPLFIRTLMHFFVIYDATFMKVLFLDAPSP